MAVKPRRRRGISLVELLISTSILMLVFAGVSAILIKGLAYLRSNQSALDAQRSAILLMNSLSREAERTNIIYTLGVDGGLVFADPYGGKEDSTRGITEQFKSNAAGQLLWQRYVCYYLNKDTHKLYRREVPYYAYPPASADTEPPPVGPKLCKEAGTPPMNVTWFADQSDLPTRLIASDVASFNVTIDTVANPASPSPSPTPSASATPDPDEESTAATVITVHLEMGDPKKNDYNHYWLELKTQISPRN